MCRKICYNRDVFRFYLPILNMSKQLLNEVFRQRKVMRYQQNLHRLRTLWLSLMTLAIILSNYHILELSSVMPNDLL